MYWTSDEHPDIHMMEMPSKNITDIPQITGHSKNRLRVMLLIHQTGSDFTIDDCEELADSMMPDNTARDEGDDAQSDNRLSTIPEE